jgi:transmembrane sensor
MSSRDSVRTSIAHEAAEWFVANRDGTPDAIQRSTFAAWLKTSPQHVEEYLGIAKVAQELRAAADPELSLETLLAQARSADQPNVVPIGIARADSAEPARKAAWRFVAAAAAMLAAVAVATLWWRSDRVSPMQYATRHGEQLMQRLADNSVLRLDTDTAVTVRFSRGQRLVEVEKGQVLFEVAHETGRNFRVLAGPADVVAIGTRFDVRLQQDSTLVSVLEGQIAVGLAPAQPGTAVGAKVLVHAGEQVQVASNQLPAQAVPAQIQRNTAWLRRQIVFEQEPLASVVAEFNRYGDTPIEIETPALRALVISGTFSADDTESFVAFLRSLEGVRVEVTSSRIRVRRM